MNKGYTLVELLVVSLIMTILFLFGVANYTNFNRQRIVSNTALDLINNLRLAQSRALNGQKPDVCAEKVLDGWKLKFTSSKEYQIFPVCNGEDQDCSDEYQDDQDIECPMEEYQLNPSVSKIAGPDEIFFKVLAQGVVFTGSNEIKLSGFGKTYVIKISQGGEIEDGGFE